MDDLLKRPRSWTDTGRTCVGPRSGSPSRKLVVPGPSGVRSRAPRPWLALIAIAGVAGVLAAAWGALPASAETLSLADAMARARENAREVTAAEAQRRAREAQLDEARAYRLPKVTLSELWIRTDAPAEAFALELNQERFSFQDFVMGDPNDPDPLSSATTRLQVSAPLYTGGALSARVEQARLGVEAAGDQLRRTGDQVAFAAAEAYLQLVQARENVALLERSLDTLDAHVRLARSHVEQGMLVRSELLRAEVERARVSDHLAAARGQAEVAEAALSFRIGAPLDTGWSLESLPPLGELAGLETWLRAAADRDDLRAARRGQEIAQLEARVRRAARLPQVGAEIRYDRVDEQLFGGDGDNLALMASASIDLFAGGRHKAAVAAARAEAEAAAAQVAQLEDAVRLEIRSAHVEAASARQRLETSRAALQAASETERIVEARFRQGIVKTVDLLDAVTARRETELRELVARTDTHRTMLQLALAAGSLDDDDSLSPER